MLQKNQWLLLGAAIIFITLLGSCGKTDVNSGDSNYTLNNSNYNYNGNRTNDASLKAITIPCQNNNTFRMYYSDSAATLGLPDSITIVSYSKRTHLGYKECCIEATSSATDTWLSTGYNNPKLVAGHHSITQQGVWMQHFTSMAQPDSTTLYFFLAGQ